MIKEANEQHAQVESNTVHSDVIFVLCRVILSG